HEERLAHGRRQIERRNRPVEDRAVEGPLVLAAGADVERLLVERGQDGGAQEAAGAPGPVGRLGGGGGRGGRDQEHEAYGYEQEGTSHPEIVPRLGTSRE